jgi:hypothetical protein
MNLKAKNIFEFNITITEVVHYWFTVLNGIHGTIVNSTC